jgi:hypothetical protein
MRLLFAVIMSSFLFSCQTSPNKNYYLLTASNPTSAQQSNPAPATLIGIGPIEVSDYLNRLRVIYQTGDNNVVVADNDYWAESLDKGIPRVVALNLTQRDNSRSFVNFPWRTDSVPAYSIRINVQSMTLVNNEAHLVAAWEIFDNTKKVNIERRYFSQSIPVKNEAKALAKAYSELLGIMSIDIDQALRKL